MNNREIDRCVDDHVWSAMENNHHGDCSCPGRVFVMVKNLELEELLLEIGWCRLFSQHRLYWGVPDHGAVH